MSTLRKQYQIILVLAGLALTAQTASAFYNPNTGRWLSRDPIGETGFMLMTTGQQPTTETESEEEFAGRTMRRRPSEANLYGFVLNDPENRIDPLGLLSFEGCLPRAEEIVRTAINDACYALRDIENQGVKCCMGGGLGGEDYAKLLALCRHQMFKVKCEPVSPNGACAIGLSSSNTITVYNVFFDGDGCGWGAPCVMAHEMLHLTGLVHPEDNGHFTLLHQCLGCPHYPP